jgi:glutathione synthase/RimK-type ligase-like ATP-grasp enzyme
MNVAWTINEDHLLMKYLQAIGHTVGRKSYEDSEFDWSLTKAAVTTTPWERYEGGRLDGFYAFTQDTSKKTSLLPSHDTIQWIDNKAGYMKVLQDAGINALPFVFVKGYKEGEVAKESNVTLRQIKEEKGWETLVFKPNVAMRGKWVEKVTKSDFDKKDNQFQHLISLGHDMLVQEFQSSISEQGEVGVVVIGNNVTHAVLKKPKPGGFLVHEHWGGTYTLHVPIQEEIAFAEKVLRVSGVHFGPFPYARVDMIRDNSNELALIELTAIAPGLQLASNPEAAKVLAEHLHHGLHTICSCEDSGRSEL